MNYSHCLTKDIYFVTLTIVRWIDLFTRPKLRHIIVDSLKYCQDNKGLELYGYVLMSNHLHALVSTEEEKNELSDILRDFKKYTAKAIYETIRTDPAESRREWILYLLEHEAKADHSRKRYKLWQRGSYIEEVISADFFFQKLTYIHQNPVRSEIVAHAEYYLYSSARNYADEQGLLEIQVVR